MHTPQRTLTLTLTTLALLVLTGCADQKTGTIPEPPPSNTSVASASASASESYSGGSKAPDGEYRPADEHGPAQNVPKPVEPEGMNVETVEGLEKFIKYWNDLRNYALQTGDVAEIKKLVDESFTQEQDFYTALDQMYTAKGWVIGGGRAVHYNKDLLISHGNGEYSIGANFEVKDSVFWLDGQATYNDNSNAVHEGVELKFKFQDSAWIVTDADIIN